MKVKLCGIRRLIDIEYVNLYKPDYIGFIFAPSKRKISIEDAKKLISALDKNIKTVGVFVNAQLEDILNTQKILNLNAVQLHGDEDINYLQKLKNMINSEIWKAVRVKSSNDIFAAQRLGADRLLLDSYSPCQYGGTGKTSDWGLIKKTEISEPFFLAGGLNCDNILEAIKTASPFGVDISGGIETNGFKDKNKIKNIMNIIRSESI